MIRPTRTRTLAFGAIAAIAASLAVAVAPTAAGADTVPQACVELAGAMDYHDNLARQGVTIVDQYGYSLYSQQLFTWYVAEGCVAYDVVLP